MRGQLWWSLPAHLRKTTKASPFVSIPKLTSVPPKWGGFLMEHHIPPWLMEWLRGSSFSLSVLYPQAKLSWWITKDLHLLWLVPVGTL